MSIRFILYVSILLGLWLGYSILTFPIINVYHYESACGQWEDIEVPAKGRTLRGLRLRFKKHKRGCNRAPHVLRRTTARDWSNCFNWSDNIHHERWSIPYHKPRAQAKRR